jgi:hypothetical protein
MKSRVGITFSSPLPPCPISHSYPFALPILSFLSSKRTLTAARKSEIVNVGVPLHGREASLTVV